MKSPNWQEARAFVDRIAGAPDPAMTFQVFDDKGERYELASWKHGRLSDPAVRKFLTSKADQGCGVYVVVSACDGKGRRRKNVTHARANFIDLDGQPLPDKWESGFEPDIINETSPGKYHAFWLTQNVEDLNAFSDCQARLAAFFNADPRVFDPPRVVRLPGFYHQKKDPFRSRTIRICSPEAAEQFERRELAAIADAHECTYDAPAQRAEGGRSDEPTDGWDSPMDVDRATEYLKTAKLPKIGDRNNRGYRVAAKLNDYGISPELSFELMNKFWNERMDDPLKDHEIQHVIKSAGRYKDSPAGSESGADDFEEIDADDLDAIVEQANAKTEFEFEEEFRPAVGPDFNFEEPADFDFEEAPVKRRPKTIERLTKGVSWSYGHEIRAEPLTWLWPNRIPKGKLTIIAGFPDNGKSQILLNLAACVSNGSSWPNDEGVAPQGVAIILSSEDDKADTLIPRLAAAGANLENIIVIGPMVKEVVEGNKRRRVLNIDDDLDAISKIIKEVHASGRYVRMIGLDPINAYFGGSKKADSHKTADMRALLTPISEWAAKLKIAVVCISHFNKGGNSHTLYRITDSGAITAAARAVMFALKVKPAEDASKDDPIERVFISGKHNLSGDHVKGLTYTMDTRNVSQATGVPNQVMPYVIFGGETDITAEEAMDGAVKKAGGRKPKDRSTAMEFLRGMLADGPKEVAEIMATAKAAGFTEHNMRDVAPIIGFEVLKPTKYQGTFRWALADSPVQEFADERDADHADDHPFG